MPELSSSFIIAQCWYFDFIWLSFGLKAFNFKMYILNSYFFKFSGNLLFYILRFCFIIVLLFYILKDSKVHRFYNSDIHKIKRDLNFINFPKIQSIFNLFNFSHYLNSFKTWKFWEMLSRVPVTREHTKPSDWPISWSVWLSLMNKHKNHLLH